MEGIPIGVKDNIDIVGFQTTGGTSALIGHMP
jgi:Asp-tRNA(Asn)/Glu-tRNA(Gln) amidotransferase A subunit family amidase